MPGNYLLDTNIAIAFLENEEAVVNAIRQANNLWLPTIAVGELYYGALKSGRPQQNLSRIHALAERLAVLACTVQTALRYGEIKLHLRNLGRPIPDNDLWIAALAVEHSLILVSRDKHFSDIPDLGLEIW